ncbi:MAG: DUF1080 domain-containing protein [Phycisphaerae bacterium]|nr:DUF1080 domain-containing protein [Phycisphaerae bacterium]
MKCCKTRITSILFLSAIMLAPTITQAADGWTKIGLDDCYNSDEWIKAGDAALDPSNPRRLVAKDGSGVLINGKIGKTKSLVTKRRDYRDIEFHVEFMLAKGSNSGIIFHGNHEIQILDSAHVKKPTGGHCGGVYPRAAKKPTYHHIDKGSPPRVNAAKKPGVWQSYDIIFQAARFDKAGKKTANAKFVKVVHNGILIQENVEVPYACGPNWDRKQHPQGMIIIQGDYGPIAVRNVRIRDWKPGVAKAKNAPPEGFTALFNGKDFTGWRMNPKARKMWSIENGVLKAPGLLTQWGADLTTQKEYKDFVLLFDYRMPTSSDSGINFRRLIPKLKNFGRTAQLNLGTGKRMGQLDSLNLMSKEMREELGIKKAHMPKIKPVSPKIGDWHTVKMTLVGRTLSAELDGETIIDKFEYPKNLLATEPAPISLQKHRFLEWGNPPKKYPCPIEFRNMYIKEIKDTKTVAKPGKLNVPPKGFTALFNGKDFTNWNAHPRVREFWSIENGVLKSPGLLKKWGAGLQTKKHYRDFILMAEFRMPTISDSGISFRRLIPKIPGFGTQEQFNLRSKGGMGHLESYYFLPKPTAKKHGLTEKTKPHVRYIDPKVGVWHKVKITMKGRTITTEYDGEVLLDKFKYHDWMINMEPAPIRFQKHIFVDGDNLGRMNPCPIEYRNIFIKDLRPSE